MARINKSEGRNVDWPQLEAQNLAAAGAGSGSDFESVILTVPVVTGANNALKVRSVYLIPGAVITGVATNNFTVNINQRRAGTNLGAIASVTFASGTNGAAWVPISLTPTTNNDILSGDVLTVARVSNGTGLASPAMAVEVEWVPFKVGA